MFLPLPFPFPLRSAGGFPGYNAANPAAAGGLPAGGYNANPAAAYGLTGESWTAQGSELPELPHSFGGWWWWWCGWWMLGWYGLGAGWWVVAQWREQGDRRNDHGSSSIAWNGLGRL